MGVYLYTPRAGKRFKAFDELSKQTVTIFPLEFAWKYCMSWSSQQYYKEDFHLGRIYNAAWRAVKSKNYEGIVSLGDYDGAPVIAMDKNEAGWVDTLDYPGVVLGYLHKDKTGWKIVTERSDD